MPGSESVNEFLSLLVHNRGVCTDKGTLLIQILRFGCHFAVWQWILLRLSGRGIGCRHSTVFLSQFYFSCSSPSVYKSHKRVYERCQLQSVCPWSWLSGSQCHCFFFFSFLSYLFLFCLLLQTTSPLRICGGGQNAVNFSHTSIIINCFTREYEPNDLF